MAVDEKRNTSEKNTPAADIVDLNAALPKALDTSDNFLSNSVKLELKPSKSSGNFIDRENINDKPLPPEAADEDLSSTLLNTDENQTKFYIGDESIQSPRYLQERKFSIKRLARSFNLTNEQKNNKSKNVCPTFTPPDGGYGWVIAFSAFFVNTFIVGFLKSYGVLYVSIKEKFPDATAYQISWVPVFLGTFGLLIAPLTGYLCRRFTSRKVTFFGGLLIFVGIFSGAYATSVIQLILTFGLLTGLGYGLTSTPGILVVSLYFEKRRGLASAICASGNAFGGFLFPPLLEYLISAYQLKGAMLIMAALQLNICAFSLLFRPIRVHALVQEQERRRRLANEDPQDFLLNAENNYFFKESDQGFLRSDSLLRRIQLGRKRFVSESSDVENDELHRQISFIRSSSMLNSIPDLTLYAKSWSVINNPLSSLDRNSPTKLSLKSSKASFSNLASMINNRSQLDLSKGSVNWVLPNVRRSSSVSVASSAITGSQVPVNRLASCKRTREPIMSPLAEDDRSIHDEDESTCDELVPIEKAIDNNKFKRGNVSFSSSIPAYINYDKPEMEEELPEPKPKIGCCTLFSNLFDFSLLKNTTFLIVNASMFFFMAGNPHALFFLPAFAASIDIDKTRIVSLLSISSIVDLVGRLSIGFFADFNIISADKIYIICSLLSMVSVTLIPNCTSYTQLAVMLSMFGFGVGSWFVMMPTVLIKNHGPTRLASSFGLVRMFHGLMNFSAPQIMGLIFDATGSYGAVYYFMGSCMALSTLFMVVQSLRAFIIDTRKAKKTSKYIEDVE